jgi:hypothetical protein
MFPGFLALVVVCRDATFWERSEEDRTRHSQGQIGTIDPTATPPPRHPPVVMSPSLGLAAGAFYCYLFATPRGQINAANYWSHLGPYAVAMAAELAYW